MSINDLIEPIRIILGDTHPIVNSYSKQTIIAAIRFHCLSGLDGKVISINSNDFEVDLTPRDQILLSLLVAKMLCSHNPRRRSHRSMEGAWSEDESRILEWIDSQIAAITSKYSYIAVTQCLAAMQCHAYDVRFELPSELI